MAKNSSKCRARSPEIPARRSLPVTSGTTHTLIAYAGGKPRKNHIRIIAGDAITLKCTTTSPGPHHLRHLPPRTGGAGQPAFQRRR